MVSFAPMGGAHCGSMSIIHVEPTQPAYVPICVSCCCIRLERSIHPCSCWGYTCHWRAINEWGDASIPSRNLLCKCPTSATTSRATCAPSTTSTTLATATTMPGVEDALCRSCKRLLPHVLDWGDLKLCVGGRGVCREPHRCHLLLDSQLIGCQFIDCRGYLLQDSCCPSICGSEGAGCCEHRCLCDRCCIIGCVCVLVLALQYIEHICATTR
jgi:hypothetical protein